MRLFWLAIAVVVACALAPMAATQAASFACADAANAIERAICDDPELSAADDAMALAYAHAMAGLTEEAGIVVNQGQRDWLRFSDTVCADSNLPGIGAVDGERVACLLRQYKDRLAALGENRLVNGYRFYAVDRYEALPEPRGGRFKLGLKVSSSLRIDGADAFAQAFNEAARQITERYSGQFEDFAGTTVDDTAAHRDNSSRMHIVSHNAMRLTIRLDLSSYGHGAAHPNTSFGMFHFLWDEARQLTAGDIFAGKRWSAALAKLVAARASADLRDNTVTYDAASMAPVVDDTLQWQFTRAGLLVQFEPGEVLPGSPAVVVPWSALDNVLAPGASALAIWD